MKYHIITFGCQMNRNDSERIASVLEDIGYKPASRIDEADLVVINMCSVRQSAVDRVYGLIPKIEKLKKKNKKRKSLLTGCILKNDLEKFIKHFDFILHIKTLPLWSKFLKNKSYFYFPSNAEIREFYKKFGIKYLKIKPKYSSSFRAFVPIGTGCNNFCTFCVVPFTRGPEFSRPPKDIINEIKELSKKGYKEIWLLGQNVDSYKYGKTNFAKLIEKINKIPGNFWIRFTSPHPKDFTKELIETMAKSLKITPYINLPVQSGDDEILEKMRRPYTVKQYKKNIGEIRKSFQKYRKGSEKDVSISTDIIVGFPGETKKQFQNTLKLIKEIKFDSVYLARYSPRYGTKAKDLKGQVSDEEKKRREKILQASIEKISLGKNKKFIGKIVEALVENKRDGFLIGKTRHHKTIKIEDKKGNKNLIGQFIKAKVINATPFGLEGEILEEQMLEEERIK